MALSVERPEAWPERGAYEIGVRQLWVPDPPEGMPADEAERLRPRVKPIEVGRVTWRLIAPERRLVG